MDLEVWGIDAAPDEIPIPRLSPRADEEQQQAGSGSQASTRSPEIVKGDIPQDHLQAIELLYILGETGDPEPQERSSRSVQIKQAAAQIA